MRNKFFIMHFTFESNTNSFSIEYTNNIIYYDKK